VLCEDLKVIADTARRSADLTRRLLMFGRRTEANPGLVVVQQVVETNFNLLRQTIDRRIVLECEIPANLPSLWLSVGDVQQILVNLLLNARDTLVEKLSQPGSAWTPRIRVTAAIAPAGAATPLVAATGAPPSQWIKITCRDNGMGMLPEVVERAFEPFYTTKQVGHGTGLGLATVWHLVAEMGGRVDVDSVPGEGTSFHVFLPVHQPVRPPPEPPATPPSLLPAPPTRANAERVHLLVVEDDEPVAQLIEQVLKRLGYVVTRASDGLLGWEKLTAGPANYHALVLDLDMPGLAGTELLQRARSLPYDRPVVIVSGRITDEERRKLVLLRASAIVQKPFTIETFTAAIATAGLSPHRKA